MTEMRIVGALIMLFASLPSSADSATQPTTQETMSEQQMIAVLETVVIEGSKVLPEHRLTQDDRLK